MRKDRMPPSAMVLAASLAACLLVLGGCKTRLEEEIGTADSPLVLVMSKSTTKGKAGAVVAVREVLERETGLHIEVEIPPTSARAIQLFSGRRADAGLLGPFEYLLARRVYGVEAGLQLLREGPTYEGTILVKADSDIQRLEDLAGRRIAYTDPYSMTGFVLPAAKLQQAKVDVDAIYAGSHDEALEMLEAGRVHATATYLRRAKGELEQRGLRILERTGPVANEPLFFRKDLANDKRETLARGFQAAMEDTRFSAAMMELFGADGVAPIDDAAYDEMERIAGEAGKEVQSLVPGGWFVHHSAQEPLIPTP